MNLTWKHFAPVVVAIVIALIPAPPGLPQYAWYYFAIFVGVIVGLILEPLPGGAIGLIGITIVILLSEYAFYSPEQLAKPGFHSANASLAWGLSGFSNTTVWLIFGAFMFALGYDKTGLGKRIALILVQAMGRKTLTLGYAVLVADLALAPFTPSNTARSGGTIYPVISNLPPLYDSKPNDPSARKIGSYLMWVAIAATCVTSSLFMTGLAPNVLAIEIVKKTVNIEFEWITWFFAFIPAGLILLALVPLLAYWLYPPEIKAGEEIPKWAAGELAKMGGLTRNEILLLVFVLTALLLWVFGADLMNATTVVLVVIGLLLITGVIKWSDMTSYKDAWNTLAWFATLVALADGLARVGFIKWFAETVGAQLGGMTPVMAIIVLALVNHFVHYLFASVTAHVTAVLPVLLAVGASIPGMPVEKMALLLCLQLGIMGIITPYGTGPSPVYYGSGFIPSADWWRLGAIFGLVYLGVYMVIIVPWVMLR